METRSVLHLEAVWVLVLVGTWFVGLRAQLSCSVHRDMATTPATTASPSINLSCSVDRNNVLELADQVLWQWVKLAPDANSIESELGSGEVSEFNFSMLVLSALCENGGPYQAFYFNTADNNSCLFSCFFFAQVMEVRPELLLAGFSTYPVIQMGMVPSSSSEASTINGKEGSMQSVGRCGNRFFLRSKCEVDVVGTWYRNGIEIDIENYIVFSSGELQIQNLTNYTVGYYVCVTTLSNHLHRSYQTHSANIILSVPTTSALTQTSLATSSVTTEIDATNNLVGVFKGWQFGLIIGAASLVIVVLLMAGAVWMGYLTVKKRREEKKPRKVAHLSRTQRTKSIMEEIQMVGDAESDMMDYGGPVEIAFSAILFEELLHKGTFKVVHHAIVNQPVQGMLSFPVAVKRLKDEKSELGYEELMSEACFLKTFQEKAGSHPNIVSLLGMTTRGGPTCLLLEFVPNGTLEQFLISLLEGPTMEWYMKFTRDTLRGAYHKHVSGDLMNIIVQVAEGMNYLTNQGFIHRDLSTRNILMGESLNVKITNPGMHHEGYYYVVSEREFFLQDMAPECLWEKRYSIWSDIWSFGILVYRTVTLNCLPFPDIEVNDLHGRIVGGERPQLLTSFSNELYFLLQRCWQFVPTERPSFPTIIGDLAHMAEKPTRHIILKATKDCTKPGYISDNGQVFLLALPPHALQEDPPQKKANRRSSGTIRSLISSIDDTVYTRETAETVLDFTQSENENDNYNNYEQYLKGDLMVPLVVVKSEKRQSYETDTSGNDVGTGTPEVFVAGKGSTGSAKKKKRRTPSSGSRGKSGGKRKNKDRVGFVNTMFQGVEGEGKEVSTDDAPSITEEEEKEGNTSDLSVSEVGDSKEHLVEL